jgi:hypothetical protein
MGWSGRCFNATPAQRPPGPGGDRDSKSYTYLTAADMGTVGVDGILAAWNLFRYLSAA